MTPSTLFQRSASILEDIKGLPADTHVCDATTLFVGELRSLCSTVVRLETYLTWAGDEAARGVEVPSESWLRGYRVAHEDVRAFVLDGKLEGMLDDEGYPQVAALLRGLGVSS